MVFETRTRTQTGSNGCSAVRDAVELPFEFSMAFQPIVDTEARHVRAYEALGRALSERGGLGIANKIIDRLSAPGNENASGMVTVKAHGDTVMKGLK